MKLKFLLLIFAVSLFSSLSWGQMQTWNLTSTMTATFDNGYLTISTTKAEGEAMPNFSSGGAPWHALIGKAPFYSVVIGNNVKSIGAYAFQGCLNSIPTIFPTVSIPKSVETIGEYAFEGCTDLDVTVNWATPQTVPANAIFGTHLHVPKGTVALYRAATAWKNFQTISDGEIFSLSPTMTATLNGQGVLTVSTTANAEAMPNYKMYPGPGQPWFQHPWSFNNNIQSVVIEDKITTIGSGTFSNCSSLYSITIPNSITLIEGYAFFKSNLTSITIPSSVKSIGEYAFGNDHDAQLSVTVEWTTPLVISPYVFSSVDLSKNVLNVPTGTVALYRAAPVWKSFFSIGDKNVYSVSLSPTMTATLDDKDTLTISTTANSEAMPSPSFPFNVMFSSAISLVIENNISSISDNAFAGCTNLTSVTIPNSVITIGDNAFNSDKNIANVTVERSTPPTVSSNTFNGVNTSSATLHVPYGTRALYQAAPVWKDFGTIDDGTPNYTLSVSPTSLNFTVSGEQKSFSITSNTAWTVSSNASWLTVSPASGSNNSTINVTAAANTATTQRTAIITVGGTGVNSQTINVTQDAVIPVTSVTLNKTTDTLIVGKTLQLIATVTPANATNPSVRWSSSNEAVATVSTSGLISAKAVGTAVIIVTTVDGGFSKMCNVEVGNQDIETPGDSQTGTNGKGTINLSLTIPGDATVTGSFLIQFPEGLTLDEQLTVLSAELSGNFSLTFTSKGNNIWLIEIKTSGLRSSSETPAFKKIMDIAYKVSSGIQKGTYQASIKNLDFKMDDGTPVKKDLIPVTINVSQSFTSIDNINNMSFYASIINNVLKIESPQAETIKIYSPGGVLLFSALKNAGTIEIPVSLMTGSVYIIQGSVSGVIKIIK